MQTWDVTSLDIDPHRPEILSSGDAARVIVLALPAGESLDEHQVHEDALVVVVSGRIEADAGEQSESGGPGFVAGFAAQERHEVRAIEDSRLLLVLAPWPGDGHPGAMTLDEKATARERARERAQAD